MIYISRSKQGWIIETKQKVLFLAPTLAALENWMLEHKPKKFMVL